MSEKLTKPVTVKTKAKKKSGYEVEEFDGKYIVSKHPPRARVNEGDKIVSINGVPATDFKNEKAANDLIESVQLVVVPKADLDEYDRLKAKEDAAAETGLVVREDDDDGDDVEYTCENCGHVNVNPERDEEGDLVCEECGHVIPEVS